MVAVPLVSHPFGTDTFGGTGGVGATGFGATGFGALMVLCDAMVEIEAGLGADVTAADVDCRRVSEGATTGRACASRATRTAAATRSSHKGAAARFLVLTIASI
ncbi:MAG TPA: hypothetical protein VNU27_10760 [Candidatus Acidoferrum sp.]|nr:hypothetical protein [Candidatus Acidoferrum sp.]